MTIGFAWVQFEKWHKAMWGNREPGHGHGYRRGHGCGCGHGHGLVMIMVMVTVTVMVMVMVMAMVMIMGMGLRFCNFGLKISQKLPRPFFLLLS